MERNPVSYVRSRARIAYQQKTDGEVVRAHVEGDDLAFPELVHRYGARLHNFVVRRTFDDDHAQDLVQEVFIRVDRHAYRFNHTSKFSTWIYTIALNLIRNDARNRKRHSVLMHGSFSTTGLDEKRFQFADPSPGPDARLMREDAKLLVQTTISELPINFRSVFSLREIDGRSYEDIAHLTGCNLGTVKSRLSRAREAFRNLAKKKLL